MLTYDTPSVASQQRENGYFYKIETSLWEILNTWIVEAHKYVW